MDLTFSFVKLMAVKIGIIYLVSGFGGSVLSSLFIRDHISVGASGALFGLLGAMLSELITNWTIYSNKVSVPNSLSHPDLWVSSIQETPQIFYTLAHCNQLVSYL